MIRPINIDYGKYINIDESAYWDEIRSLYDDEEIFNSEYYLNDNFDARKPITKNNRLYLQYPLHKYLWNLFKTNQMKEARNILYERYYEETKKDHFWELIKSFIKSAFSYLYCGKK